MYPWYYDFLAGPIPVIKPTIGCPRAPQGFGKFVFDLQNAPPQDTPGKLGKNAIKIVQDYVLLQLEARSGGLQNPLNPAEQ